MSLFTTVWISKEGRVHHPDPKCSRLSERGRKTRLGAMKAAGIPPCTRCGPDS